MSSVTMRALLAESIDYAGLFPPAAQSMRAVVANYDAYRRSTDAWALGRLIVPAVRLTELWERGSQLERGHGPTWRVSAVSGGDVAKDSEQIAAFNAVADGAMLVDVAEVRASSVAEIRAVTRAFAEFSSVFIEIPLTHELPTLLDAIVSGGAKAKIRAGGTVQDAFPSPVDVGRFLRGCVERALPFKATAGLHHPLRGAYPLTYERNAACATMFGFLNMLLAASLARAGADESTIIEMLGESDRAALTFDDEGATWRGMRIPRVAIADTRTKSCLSFGSCSFREPLDELLTLGML
ncbi:MAG: hypothetical protein V4550_15780 [Gemmatimonadota bacterium]